MDVITFRLRKRHFLRQHTHAHTHTPNQLKTVTNDMAMQRLTYDFRLHEDPHMGDIHENEPKRGFPTARCARLFHLDLRVDLASPNEPLFRRGAIV